MPSVLLLVAMPFMAAVDGGATAFGGHAPLVRGATAERVGECAVCLAHGFPELPGQRIQRWPTRARYRSERQVACAHSDQGTPDRPSQPATLFAQRYASGQRRFLSAGLIYVLQTLLL